MKVTKRPEKKRGKGELGWLHARYTFSFADYYDPDHLGFRSLKVMNNDIIEPGGGFATHSHSNMEIFTYIVEGSLKHQDSIGNGSILSAGQLQYMSAGSGINHSEFNPSSKKKTELYQIWLKPKQDGGSPLYKEIDTTNRMPSKDFEILFSGSGREGSTIIRQDAEIAMAEIRAGSTIKVNPNPLFSFGWIQVVSGRIKTCNQELEKSDGLAIEGWIREIALEAMKNSKVLLFRLK
tara:strand:- start:592 stop:1299 length:708 start_codon:yes stop_codon:yes gene_type:complete